MRSSAGVGWALREPAGISEGWSGGGAISDRLRRTGGALALSAFEAVVEEEEDEAEAEAGAGVRNGTSG